MAPRISGEGDSAEVGGEEDRERADDRRRVERRKRRGAGIAARPRRRFAWSSQFMAFTAITKNPATAQPQEKPSGHANQAAIAT